MSYGPGVKGRMEIWENKTFHLLGSTGPNEVRTGPIIVKIPGQGEVIIQEHTVLCS